MSKIEKWSAPRSDAMLASYRILGNTLRACDAHNGDAHRENARRTFELWKAAQAFSDVSLMVVKTGDKTSLGLRNGGVIVEGKSNLNLGLFNAATRNLGPVDLPLKTDTGVSFKDRFKTSFWNLTVRLQGSVLPRAYAIELGSVAGVVHANNGQFRFTGDFENPVDFVAELRAACEVNDEIICTLTAYDEPPDVPEHSFADLLTEVTECVDNSPMVFDAEGWPLKVDKRHSPEILHCLSAMAAATSKIKRGDNEISVSLLSPQTKTIVSMTGIDETTLEARIN